uniref:Uncharacterized protein n=1 Tax=Nelumbo nucifera TaxID=4432 RepID=A0A822Y1T1_NELNU|nr:TPA_asm: hypothetical protein HUJ06_027670 [Nelumbo nucifera]
MIHGTFIISFSCYGISQLNLHSGLLSSIDVALINERSGRFSRSDLGGTNHSDTPKVLILLPFTYF